MNREGRRRHSTLSRTANRERSPVSLTVTDPGNRINSERTSIPRPYFRVKTLKSTSTQRDTANALCLGAIDRLPTSESGTPPISAATRPWCYCRLELMRNRSDESARSSLRNKPRKAPATMDAGPVLMAGHTSTVTGTARPSNFMRLWQAYGIAGSRSLRRPCR